MLVVTASAGLANMIKFGVGSLASLRVTTFAAEVLGDPGISELASVASREGFTFVVAVLFLYSLFTQRLKITDPKADSDVKATAVSVAAMAEALVKLDLKLDGVVDDAAKSRQQIAADVERATASLSRMSDRLDTWNERRNA